MDVLRHEVNNAKRFAYFTKTNRIYFRVSIYILSDHFRCLIKGFELNVVAIKKIKILSVFKKPKCIVFGKHYDGCNLYSDQPPPCTEHAYLSLIMSLMLSVFASCILLWKVPLLIWVILAKKNKSEVKHMWGHSEFFLGELVISNEFITTLKNMK